MNRRSFFGGLVGLFALPWMGKGRDTLPNQGFQREKKMLRDAREAEAMYKEAVERYVGWRRKCQKLSKERDIRGREELLRIACDHWGDRGRSVG